MLKRYAVVVTSLVAIFAFGAFSNTYLAVILARYGVHQNWMWPAICLAAIFCLRLGAGVRFEISPDLRRGILFCLAGIALGIGLQLSFLAFGRRRPFRYHGIVTTVLLFQIVVSFIEEALFRGSLQNYLANQSRSVVNQTVSALLVSLPFGLIHGLNPVLFHHGSFDTDWFIGTFALSFVAGTYFAFAPFVIAAFGVHFGFNLISFFF